MVGSSDQKEERPGVRVWEVAHPEKANSLHVLILFYFSFSTKKIKRETYSKGKCLEEPKASCGCSSGGLEPRLCLQ